MNGTIISIEGINGVGKTYFENKLRERFLGNDNILFVSEVSNRIGSGLEKKIITALSHTNDRFFRMGLPITETFLLLSLKMYDYESVISKELEKGKVIIEDRSIDTIAIYQSVMLCQEQQDRMLDTANEIYLLASKYRRAPDITFFLEDKTEATIERAQARNGNLYSEEELEIVHNAAHLYSKFANLNKDRIIRFNRQTMSTEDISSSMEKIILERSKLNESD
jgi:dTMP kinase